MNLSRHYRKSLTYNGLTYNFLTLQWCKSDTHSVESIYQILNLSRLAIFSLSSLVILGHGCKLRLPVSHTITWVNNQHSYSITTEPFCISLSVEYSINYMRYSTLPSNLALCLVIFPNRQANISVLSTFKVG